MWKYVTRRLKETIERTCNVVDIGKTWSCGAQQTAGSTSDNYAANEEDLKKHRSPSKCSVLRFVRCLNTNGSSSSNNKGKNESSRKRIDEGQDDNVYHDLLGAITWSGAIICGWYASQLLCLNQRHFGWDNKNHAVRLFNTPSRALHANILSHFAFTSPTQPSFLTEKVLKEKFSYSILPDVEKTDISHQVFYEVNNQPNNPTNTSKKQSVGDAVAGLVNFLGETEFRIGVQNIHSGHYRAAVAHLKLATAHNHPGATFNLGLCYEKGLGVKQSFNRAMKYYQIASSMGHSKAMYNLGVFYANGLGGLKKDYSAARQCFATAAELGLSEAKLALELDPKRDTSYEKENSFKNEVVDYIRTTYVV